MSRAEIDRYLADLNEPKRTTLQQLRQTILEVIPEAEEGMSYHLPAFRLDGKVIAGFAAFKTHLSYFPHSGAVFTVLRDEVASYRTSKGALQFPVNSPLPTAVPAARRWLAASRLPAGPCLGTGEVYHLAPREGDSQAFDTKRRTLVMESCEPAPH